MKIVIQKVIRASVIVKDKIVANIGKGMLVLVGIQKDDNDDDINWLTKKIVNLRVFNDNENIMNKSIIDTNGNIIVVSQFTLHASTKKGNRPSYLKAAKPSIAIAIYKKFVNQLEKDLGKKIQTGIFGAKMELDLLNDGPVTIIIDTKEKQ